MLQTDLVNLVNRIFESIDAWTATEAHLWDCIGYSEGQLCCLEKDHPARAVLRALIEQAVRAGKAIPEQGVSPPSSPLS